MPQAFGSMEMQKVSSKMKTTTDEENDDFSIILDILTLQNDNISPFFFLIPFYLHPDQSENDFQVLNFK